MNSMKRVEDHPMLLKNPLTGVLINIDEDSYDAVKKKREYDNSLINENKELRQRIDEIEKILYELKEVK